MSEYKLVKYPARLKGSPLTGELAEALKAGVDAAIGLDRASGASQLDIRYVGSKTVVVAVNAPEGTQPWSFAGRISPEDCRDHFLANTAEPDGAAIETDADNGNQKD